MLRWLQTLCRPRPAAPVVLSVALPDGRDLTLGPFDRAQAPTVAGWLAHPDDARWACPQTAPPVQPRHIVDWARRADFPFVGYVDGRDRPLAYGELNHFGDGRHECWIGHLVVRPDHRGRGVGSAFCRALLHYASHCLGRPSVSLVVFPDNVHALSCYRRLGFAVAGQERKRFAGQPGEHDLVRMVWMA